jgi:hypothetical protein
LGVKAAALAAAEISVTFAGPRADVDKVDPSVAVSDHQQRAVIRRKRNGRRPEVRQFELRDDARIFQRRAGSRFFDQRRSQSAKCQPDRNRTTKPHKVALCSYSVLMAADRPHPSDSEPLQQNFSAATPYGRLAVPVVVCGRVSSQAAPPPPFMTNVRAHALAANEFGGELALSSSLTCDGSRAGARTERYHEREELGWVVSGAGALALMGVLPAIRAVMPEKALG